MKACNALIVDRVLPSICTSCGILMLLISINACSFPKYVPFGISSSFQGYWEDQVDPETFTVSFIHRDKNPATRDKGQEVARILALYRCAELASEKGDQYFEVLKLSSGEGGCDYPTIRCANCDYSSNPCARWYEFTHSYTIKLLKERPASTYRDIYDAVELRKLLRGKYPDLFESAQ